MGKMRKELRHVKCELKNVQRKQSIFCKRSAGWGCRTTSDYQPQSPVAGAAPMRLFGPVAQHPLPPAHRAVDPSPAATEGNQNLAPQATEHGCPTAVPSAQAPRVGLQSLAGGADDGRSGPALSLAGTAQQHPAAAPSRHPTCLSVSCQTRPSACGPAT